MAVRPVGADDPRPDRHDFGDLEVVAAEGREILELCDAHDLK